MVSTANPILLIPPHNHHHHQQQSHLQINLRKERWWMLTSRQTLPLNPYPLVSSTSQMNWLPMRWIVLCLPANHSWMHFERFTSLRLFNLHIIFPLLSTPILILKMKSSKQRSLANTRQIMRMSCSWCVGRARCTKWWMKCYWMMSVDLLAMSI